MGKQEKGLSRRQMLGMAIGLGGFALSGKTGSVFAQAANRLFTPPLTSGPFYPNKTARPRCRFNCACRKKGARSRQGYSSDGTSAELERRAGERC